MLKYFRKYNKWILAFGASLLMITFLLPVQNWMQQTEADHVIGEVKGRKLRMGDIRQADMEMSIVQRLSYGLLPVPLEDARGSTDALAWLLIMHEANELGLHASDEQVLALRHILGIQDDQQLRQTARALGVRPEDIHAALRNWIIAQRYQELMLGLAHVPLPEKVAHYQVAASFFMQGIPPQYFQRFVQPALGTMRISKPLIEHVIADQGARVRIEALVLDARQYLDQVEPPSEAKLQELFGRYKSDLPDESEPYGFGYRFPDRVKIEYLVLPFERVKQRAKVEEVDAYSYYEANKSLFVEQPEPLVGPNGESIPQEPRQLTYREVRQRIIEQLTDQNASKLAEDILKAATVMLNEDARRLPTTSLGYRETANFTPMPLATVAEKLEEQFGVRPDVVREDSRWLDRRDLMQLEGIGVSVLRAGGMSRAVPFADYALSAMEIQGTEVTGPLASLRLQTKLPSQPLTTFEGDRYLFRLIEAQPARDPQSLDEVREQVERDARRLAAYEKLLAERDRWVAEAAVKGIEALQLELNAQVLRPEPFPKRIDGILGVMTPNIPEIGSDTAFVDAVFELAERVMQAGGIGAVEPSARLGAVALDSKQQLLIVRLVEYSPMTRSNLNMAMSDPGVSTAIMQAVTEGTNGKSPMSREALIARTGYTGDFAQ